MINKKKIKKLQQETFKNGNTFHWDPSVQKILEPPFLHG